MFMKRNVTIVTGMVNIASKSTLMLTLLLYDTLFFDSYECTRTDSCNVEKNYTRTEYHCCEGFTTSPSGNDYHHYFHKDSPRYLKKHGCPQSELYYIPMYY